MDSGQFKHERRRLWGLVILLVPLVALGADEVSPETKTGEPSAVEKRDSGKTPVAPVNGGTVVVKDAGRVEMHVADVPLATVLRMLSTQSRKNIVASSRVNGIVTADLFDVSFYEALDSILRMNKCAFDERSNFIYVETLDEIKQREGDGAAPKTIAKLFRLKYVAVKDIKPLINPLLSKEGSLAVTPDSGKGLTPSSEEAGGNDLSVTDAILVVDYPDRIREIEKIIRELDTRPRQVLVEATILRAQLGEDNALGIDFTVVGGVDFEMLASSSPAVTDIEPGLVPTAELNNTNFTVRTDLKDAVPQGGISFGIIKDQIGVFLRALEQVTDTTVLANPKILTLNKQRGEVIVGRRDGYLTTTVTETTAVQTVDFLETGTRLIFRPFIGDDGFVRMEIHPEDSNGGLNEANLPFERTTEVTTNIIVRDGHTILIAGLFRESTSATRGQVPLLGNIPGVGALFRTTLDETAREEVIILLTVHIADNYSEYEKKGDEVAADVSRTRIGARRGMQGFGRDRLSIAHYHQALEHMKTGNYDKALWDVRMSLHISPLYVPAIKLKEKLIGRHACDRWTGNIRDVISRRLLGRTYLGQVHPPGILPKFPEPISPGEEPAPPGSEERGSTAEEGAK